MRNVKCEMRNVNAKCEMRNVTNSFKVAMRAFFGCRKSVWEREKLSTGAGLFLLYFASLALAYFFCTFIYKKLKIIGIVLVTCFI
jgi:hypothetical protein